MTDERHNLDSDPSTATAEPPADPASAAGTGDPSAAAADQPQPGATEAASPADDDAAERTPQVRDEEAPMADQPAGGEEEAAAQAAAGDEEKAEEQTAAAEAAVGEEAAVKAASSDDAAGGEEAGAAESEPPGDEGGPVAGVAEGGEDVAAAEAGATDEEERGEAMAGGEIDEQTPAAAETAPAEGAEGASIAAVGEIAGDDEAEAAAVVAATDAPSAAEQQTAEPAEEPREAATAEEPAEAQSADAQEAPQNAAPAAEPAPPSAQAAETATAQQEEAGDTTSTEGAAAAEATQSAATQSDAGAAPTAEAPDAAQPAEAVAPEAGAEGATAPEGEAAAQPADETASQREAGAAPATDGQAAALPAEAASPQPEAGGATTAEGETAAQPAETASPQPEAGAAPPTDAAPEPEEPEDPALAALREAREKGTPVEGRVIGWNRGGFHVVVGEVTAFCPSSEMEVGRPKSPQSYVEKTFPFKVIKYQKKGRRVVLSRAAVLGEKRQQVLAELKPGSVVKGRVTSLPDFGAFVDLGGIEGLVHVSEISRGRVQHPKDALQLGQEVEVKVLKVEQGGERISLSLKDLEPDPWQGAGQRFGRGDRFSGKVLRKTEFGLFVELEPDVEGLLHVSQLPPGKSIDDAEYQPGQAVEGWVREVESKRQRISLSLREVPSDDPWKEISQRFPEGESVEGTVESIAPFGVFVTLGPGVTGLLPNSQTGLPRGTNAARAFSPGQSVRVQVLSVDSRRKRISLGREGTRVEASKNDLQDFKRRERERERETPTAMAAAFARLRGPDEERDEP